MVRKGGQKTEKGTYWNIMNGEKVELEQEGTLPGEGTYLKAPTIVMLLAGPLLGLVYAIFLPFIGIAMTASVVGSRAGEAAAEAASFGWRPVEVYLAGRKRIGRVKRQARIKRDGDSS